MTTILDILGTSTPVSETLAQKIGFTRAGVACRIFFYQQLKNNVCSASIATLSKKLGMSAGAVSTNIKWLRENGYIDTVGEHKSGNVVNNYVVTQKFYDSLEHSESESKHSECESNFQNVNGEEEVKEDFKPLSNKADPPKTPQPKKPAPLQPPPLEEFGPLPRKLLEITGLRPSSLVNGTKMDFAGVKKMLEAENTTPEKLEEFKIWYDTGKPISLKAIVENYSLFLDGGQPRHKQWQQRGQKQNGKQSKQSRHNSGPAQSNRFSDIIKQKLARDSSG